MMQNEVEMEVIAVTGGIASGKTTVCDCLEKEYGFDVIDADKISREISEREDVLAKLRYVFGEDYVSDGSLNRQKLASLVFNDPAQKSMLESILHPEVAKEYERQKQAHSESGKSIVIYNCPLLFEAGLESEADRILLVYCTLEQQLSRLKQRDKLTEEQAYIRINAQMPLDEKLQYADYVIFNNGSYDELLHAVKYFAADISS